MASGIHGITVEINGNTKKLNDALKETGKETKDIKAELAQVDRLDSLGGSVGNMTGSLQGGNIPRYASGTDYHPGGLALVGEQGAELLSLPRGSKVWSNGETRRMLDPDGTPPPAGNGDTDALLRALEQGFSRVVRAVQEKDMNTYLDGTRLSRSIGRKQEWLNQTQGTSLVRG